MKTQIPIYRAKKIDSDEYVDGYLGYSKLEKCHFIADKYEIERRIDPSTLAIHFEDMKDSEGTKIFASLSKDGKGGDLTISKNIDVKDAMAIFTYTAMYDGNAFRFCHSGVKITGIQE